MGDVFIKWEYFDVIEDKISHVEGGDNDIIKDPTVSAAKLVNKYDAALNWIYNTGPQYWQGMSVLQLKMLFEIHNTTLMSEIKLTKE